MRYLGLNSLFILILAGSAAGQAMKVKEVPVKLSGTIEGSQLYREHCAVCHGVDAKGGGPAAPALKKAPTDLTQIARRNGGKYPELAVQRKIKGAEVLEHGTLDMPIWGQVLVGPGKSKTDGEMRVFALLKYLGEIQVK
jgi:mono/diheme cytochrome c family protein